MPGSKYSGTMYRTQDLVYGPPPRKEKYGLSLVIAMITTTYDADTSHGRPIGSNAAFIFDSSSKKFGWIYNGDAHVVSEADDNEYVVCGQEEEEARAR